MKWLNQIMIKAEKKILKRPKNNQSPKRNTKIITENSKRSFKLPRNNSKPNAKQCSYLKISPQKQLKLPIRSLSEVIAKSNAASKAY